MDNVKAMSGGCVLDFSVSKDVKKQWVNDNYPEWSQEQKELFVHWANWNALEMEWVVSPSTAAKIIGVKTQTVQKWCKDGKIKAYQNSISWWHIPLDVVLELQAQRQES